MEKIKPVDFPQYGISTVVTGSPAYFAGFKAGDVIVSVNDVAISSYGELPEIVMESQGQTLKFLVNRAGNQQIITATPRWEPSKVGGEGRYFLGVGRPSPVYERMGVINSLSTAWSDIWFMSSRMIEGIGEMFVGEEPLENQLAGPVRIAKISSDAAERGLYGFIVFLSVLSLNLAIMNLLPIPVLDGGHLVFCAIEAIRGKPVSKEFQNKAFSVGLAILLGIMFLAIFGDLKSLL